MNIKRADDKPMVIHTKKKAKLHAVRSRRISVKGRNVLTVERGSRLRRAYIRPVKKPTAHIRTKTKEQTSAASQNAPNEQRISGNTGKHPLSSQPQNHNQYRGTVQQRAQVAQTGQYGPKQVSLEQKIKKKDTAVTFAAAAATSKTAEQFDGGEEFKDAASVSYQMTNPLLSAGSKGAQYFKEKTLEERKRRIKVVEQRKTIDRIKISGRKNMSGSDNSIHKSQFSDDDSREDTASDQKQDMSDSKRMYQYFTHKKSMLSEPRKNCNYLQTIMHDKRKWLSGSITDKIEPIV